nr:MAG TPA: ubiquitin-binding zinc finger protein [Caudoviricetes sp.]
MLVFNVLRFFSHFHPTPPRCGATIPTPLISENYFFYFFQNLNRLFL